MLLGYLYANLSLVTIIRNLGTGNANWTSAHTFSLQTNVLFALELDKSFDVHSHFLSF